MSAHQIRLAAHLAIGCYYNGQSKLISDCVVTALENMGWDVVNGDVNEDDVFKTIAVAEAMQMELLG